MSLEVRNLYKSYKRKAEEISVLNGVSLELLPGQSLSVVGSSGIGKSTLLHCVGLIDEIDSGEISIDGTMVATQEEIRTKVRREKIGFVFQFHYLMSELTALENVMVPLLLSRKTKEEAQGLSKAWLERVGLEHRLKHRPSELSGGEQQRVAIARALVHEPKIILADEPTGNLDPETARKVFDVLKDQCKSLNSILIMATHNLDLARDFDKSMTLKKGTLI